MKAALRSCRFIFIAPIALLAAGCGEPKAVAYQGYVEGEYVLVASPDAGSLQSLNVARGQNIESGAALFTLERENETAEKREAEERLRAAQAKLENLRKGQRAPELETLIAEAEQAEAARKLSASQLARNQQLFESGFISSAGLDEAKANLARDRARVEQAQAQIRVARQSVGRTGELAAAQAEIDAAKAVVAQADWKLAQKAQRAPQAALVQDTFFVQGEWVPAGKPVVSLLPPANIKLRFFVPEAVVGQLHTGQGAKASCDGCGAPIAATISYVSPKAEFTPPVIYSKESRAKLVFMVEARPAAADAVRLKPGQPVDVTL
ncbi:MAG: HlyD family efflux transporter periplasmic adaptor subunit [Betaproteobacteria bacterium]|nr:HlyD family efflux transporter periplasmic adaptor subunit [Betaproteobacteria bacterium]